MSKPIDPALSVEATRDLKRVVIQHCYRHVPGAVIEADGGFDVAEHLRDEFDNLISGRLREFLDRQLPWIQSHLPLRGKRVLEIGSGAGSSTAAMGLLGARVDGIDVEGPPLEVARRRCELHGLDAINLMQMNGTEIDRLPGGYDLVVFFATYEHMTHAERKTSLEKAWHLLAPGGYLAIIECPNRLWYHDPHTTFRNFYNWLPDELAMDYAKFYERDEFRSAFDDGARDAGAVEKLARWGRGASYHDIEIALGRVRHLDVKEGLVDYLRAKDEGLDRWWDGSRDGQYRKLLMSFEPRVQGAFFYPWLEILIRRPARVPVRRHTGRDVADAFEVADTRGG